MTQDMPETIYAINDRRYLYVEDKNQKYPDETYTPYTRTDLTVPRATADKLAAALKTIISECGNQNGEGYGVISRLAKTALAEYNALKGSAK